MHKLSLYVLCSILNQWSLKRKKEKLTLITFLIFFLLFLHCTA